MSSTISLASADGHRFHAYVAQPATKPRGGIVVLQEIFGVNSHIRSVADGYAAAGYLAIAPETFSRVQPGVELGYTEADMNQGFALKTAAEKQVSQVLQDIAAAVAYAAQAGRVGVVGYCWGGLMSWRAACELPGIAAAVPYYGGGMTGEAEAARTPRCPVMAHFGDQDHWIPLDTVQAFAKAQPGVQVHVYKANHGFNCDQRGS
jgi:carboxymethylenebutenolidase